METLIIHPADITTSFLERIYNNNSNIHLITTQVSNSRITDEIIRHDNIILLGHGTEYGLLSKNHPDDMFFNRYIIDSRHVQFLREKNVVGIWCNAKIFAERYDLRGLFSGMIISEVEEALPCGVLTDQEEISSENVNFAENLRYCLENYDLSSIPSEFSKLNSANTQLTNFNYNSLYFF